MLFQINSLGYALHFRLICMPVLSRRRHAHAFRPPNRLVIKRCTFLSVHLSDKTIKIRRPLSLQICSSIGCCLSPTRSQVIWRYPHRLVSESESCILGLTRDWLWVKYIDYRAGKRASTPSVFGTAKYRGRVETGLGLVRVVSTSLT